MNETNVKIWFQDRELAARVSQADMAALKTVYQQNAEGLLNHLFRIFSDQQHAEDILQELFVSLPTKIASYSGRSSLSTWLFRVSHNMALQELRKEKNRTRLREENTDLIQPETLHTTAKDELELLLQNVDEETRSLLWLKEAEGLSLQELSEIFSSPEGTLKSKLSRARKKLKDILTREEA